MLSVITPVYNGADFVKRCYANLVEQTFTNWEWVVVDDGSTDDTAETVRKISDSRVRLFSYQPNRGRGYARNLALAQSRGDWIAVWDIDDLNFPERLEKVADARSRGYDYCCSYAVVVNNDLDIKGTRGFHRASGCIPREFVHPTLAVKKDIARAIGYKITRGKGGPAEDARMIWTLSLKYKGLWFDDALTIYQEDRDLHLQKAVDTNKAHLQTLKEIQSEMLIRPDAKYYCTILKYSLKVVLLNALRVSPRIYPRLVGWRDYGETQRDWRLSEEKIKFIEKQKTISSQGKRNHFRGRP